MSGGRRSGDAIDRLGAQLAAMQQQIKDLQARQPFQIPVLAADPPTSDPTNIWLFPDGRLRARHLNTGGTAYVTREWVPTGPGSSTSGTVAAPPATAPISRMTTWTAIWSQGYRESGSQRSDYPAFMHYGYIDSFNGRNRSLIGFDYTTIASALSGSTIQGVWITMTNIHAYWNSGAYLHLGIHNFSAKPSTWAGGGIPRSMISKQHWGKPETRTAQLPLEFAQAIRDGWGKGVSIESPNNSSEYYGYAAGVGSGYTQPSLIVQYAK